MAKESLDAANLLQENGYWGFAAARAYYAMFYCAQAMLEREELSFSKHSATISAFGERFAKTGRVPAKLHRYLSSAQDVRLVGDYEKLRKVTKSESNDQITHAIEFFEIIENILKAENRKLKTEN